MCISQYTTITPSAWLGGNSAAIEIDCFCVLLLHPYNEPFTIYLGICLIVINVLASSVSSVDVIAVGALWSFWCDMLYDTVNVKHIQEGMIVQHM